MESHWAGPSVLRDYAFLADGERGALIGPHGDIEWMCAPRWDSPAVFSTLVGGAGRYTVTPLDHWYVWGGHYEPGTLIWRSRWITRTGIIECREAFAFPADPHTAVLLRRVDAVENTARVGVSLDIRADFGTKPMERLAYDSEAGVWTAETGGLYIRWSAAATATAAPDQSLTGELSVPPGGRHDLVLEISDRPLPPRPPTPGPLWEATAHHWASGVPPVLTALGEVDARHAYAVLLGMTSGSGGMVAAATTSLPERAEAGRNYDYRYSWIRDQCYAGQAAASVGPGGFPLLDNAVDFIAGRILADGPRLRPAYTVDGGVVPDEGHIPQIIGYPGGGNRVGNGINDQFQLDALGEALLLFTAAGNHGRLETDHWRAVERTVAAIKERHRSPETGIWELDHRIWAHSQLVCSAGLYGIARHATRRQASRWAALADSLLTAASRDCLHPSGRWQRSPEDGEVDAALLIPAVRGALPAQDPRSVATYEAVRHDLTQEGYVYRFRHDRRPLSEAEGAFLLCGFFLALAAHQQGDVVEARGRFERGRSACGPAGLFSEEYDIDQRQLRGNLPQAFVHALFLETGTRLAQPWGESPR